MPTGPSLYLLQNDADVSDLVLNIKETLTFLRRIKLELLYLHFESLTTYL